MTDDTTQTAAHPDAPDTTATPKVPTLVYMPLPHDSDETSVAGLTFKAFEPIELPEGKRWLAQHLANNPWFGAQIDPDRHDRWCRYREAIADAEKAKLDAEAAVEAAHAESLQAEAERKGDAQAAAARQVDEAAKADAET
jgi:hypothetical protein